METASGMMLPDDYMRQVAEATHAAGGLFVLDCIASGAMWVDMKAIGVDVLVSAPQKGWSSSPAGAMVCLSERALKVMAAGLALVAFGVANMWAAIFADVGVMVLAVLNAIRALKYKD